MIRQYWPIIVAAMAAVMFGGSYVATRVLIERVDSVSLAFLRYGLAAILLLAAIYSRQHLQFAKRDILPLAGLGFLFFGFYPYIFNEGMRYVPSARGALIIATVPALTLLVSVAYRQESLSLSKIVGVILSIVGVAIVVSDSVSNAVTERNTWIGDSLLFLASFCIAFYNVLSRRYLHKYRALHVTGFGMAVGSFTLLPFALGQGLIDFFGSSTQSDWLYLAYLVVPAGALSYYMWIYALQHAAPTRVAIVLPLNVVSAAIFGAIILSEAITFRLVLGLVFVMMGIWAVNRVGKI